MSKKYFPSFSIIITFIALSIIGVSLIPKLNIKLYPTANLPTIYVSYYWPKSSARMLEQEVTSKLEGAFSSIQGLENISSKSSREVGNISLEFDEHTDMDMIRFEVSTIIRRIYPELPYGVQYPYVKVKSADYNKKSLLVYHINGSASPHFIQEWVKEQLAPQLSQVAGISEIEVSGATPFEWEVIYQNDKLHQLGISRNEIASAIEEHFKKKDLGLSYITSSNEQQHSSIIPVFFSNNQEKALNPELITIGRSGQRTIYLSDVARIRYKEKEPKYLFRIDGKNAISMVIYAIPTANQIKLAQSVKDKLKEIEAFSSGKYSINLEYDATKHIKKELEKVAWRTGLSLFILLLFILIISRRWRYLLIILISLLINLAIAVIFYYLLHLEIHLYALAGITVSLGMILDNSIVMIDHIRSQGNKKAFLAILAASLTTIGSLSIVFFLSEEQQLKLIDFAWVMIINLSISLMVALFLIPALMEKLPMKKSSNASSIKRRRKILRSLSFYEKFILISKRLKFVFIILLIFGFGIPLNLLPKKIDGNEGWKKSYNFYMNSPNGKLLMESSPIKVIGGSLRLFINHLSGQETYREPQRTKLNLYGYGPEGGTILQLNNALQQIENYLKQFDEIEQFKCRIFNSKNSWIQIYFKPEYENGNFPHFLRSDLQTRAFLIGGMDWSINGVGTGFSNRIYNGRMNSNIKFYGYNYDKLYAIVEAVRLEILKNPRIEKSKIVSEVTYFDNTKHEYIFTAEEKKLAAYQVNYGNVFQNIDQLLGTQTLYSIPIDGKLQVLHLHSDEQKTYNIWDLMHQPLMVDNQHIRLNNMTDIQRKPTGNNLVKKNQEYQLILSWDLVGPEELKDDVIKETIEELEGSLPLGFRAEPLYQNHWNTEKDNPLLLLLLIIMIIYFICSILLESLTQPLSIIAMIPISFIGVFFSFSVLKLPFDQGGYASFVLLSGISVNAALYIINDMNNWRRKFPARNKRSIYLKAFSHKLIPIILTISSTILGLIPFLINSKNEAFWFSLAVGTIGGLLFSLIAIFIYLPLFTGGMRK